jgi:general secretion pathway protein M
MRALSAPVRRLAALGILLLLLLFAYVGVAQPLLDSYAAARANTDTMRSAIARAETATMTTSDLEQQLALMKEQARSANGFLPTTSDALASATLQDLIKTAVDKVHGNLRSTQILTPRDEAAARRVAVRAQFSTDLAGMQKVVYELETTPSILFLSNVQISRQQGVAAGSRAASSALEVQFDIVGYMRGAK